MFLLKRTNWYFYDLFWSDPFNFAKIINDTLYCKRAF